MQDQGKIWWDMTTKTREELMKEVDQVLETLREGLAMHAGNVELLDVDPATGKVTVRLMGTCVGCPMSDLTLKAGIEETLMQMIPEVTEVVNAT
jgi:Fe-S cluster biogenesis protein NfuA